MPCRRVPLRNLRIALSHNQGPAQISGVLCPNGPVTSHLSPTKRGTGSPGARGAGSHGKWNAGQPRDTGPRRLPRSAGPRAERLAPVASACGAACYAAALSPRWRW